MFNLKLKKGEWFLVLFNLIYVIIFATYYVSIKNYEFLWYVLVLVFFFVLIGGTLRKTNFSYMVLWGLSIWGFLHMVGGGVRIGDGVLYALHLIPIFDRGGDFFILKFDQVVHAFGFCVATLVGWELIRPSLNKTGKVNYKIVYLLLVCIGMGLGALNEIVEFMAVVIFPNTGVGGYENTALDLVFNMIGSVIAIGIIHLRRKKS